MYWTQAHPKNAQQNTNNKYRGIHIENLRLTIFLYSALCLEFRIVSTSQLYQFIGQCRSRPTIIEEMHVV
jgi:hypothetical protein